MPGTLKNQSGQLLQSQNKPRNGKKIKPVTTKYFPFPFIPSKARTTKLAKELENIQTNQNHVQPVGCWEDICLKILFWLFLVLSDYV